MSRATLLFAVVLIGCVAPKGETTRKSDSFADDVNFLKQYMDVLLLKSDDGKMQVAVSPSLQGRVMTSSASGANGFSFGWINRDALSSGDTSTHMNAFGGEDRIWLGPEGGQFSIYFEKGKEFTFDNWHVPKMLDIEPFELVSSSTTMAAFRRDEELVNYSGTRFKFSINRQVRLLSASDIRTLIGGDVPDSVAAVAYESENILKNAGNEPWRNETGLLSIWILGMFNPSPEAVVFIPLSDGDTSSVRDNYFGKVPADRLKIRNGIAFFKADGKMRTKIGLPPSLATEWLGSFDAANNILTLVHYNKPAEHHGYVNSLWEIQKNPFDGDAINSYNDGPATAGSKPMGPFYELETSSPAAALNPADSVVHIHTTVHFQGEPQQLDTVLRRLFNLTTKDIKQSIKE